jgi:predicted KAP-like P-loop ATPase
MFKFDKPINSKNDDFLSRKNFSSHLGKSLLTWEEKESLVIALYGEWWSGKSSVINLAKEHIEESEEENKPTIIEFNPWFFSDLDNLSQYFFNEIANELEIKNDDKKDKKIAEKLKLYAKLLQIIPEKKILSDLSSRIFFGLGLLSISTSQVIQWSGLSVEWVKYVIFGLGLILFLLGFFKDFLLGFSDYFSYRADTNKRSLSELKKEIKNDLSERKKKLVIIIDDIDRLNQSEIRQIFRLVRVNADFPNTIYLLSFDRKIIEANLEEQVGVSGKDYLEKIVQVNFDIPLSKSEKIARFLFQELDHILATLPNSHEKLFDKVYSINIYKSGFGNLFKNIRDVKRFASSLQFNISQMHQKGVMEVNPIDFIAIEAIRLFAPDFYAFIKSNSSLFTSTDRNNNSSRENNPRKDEIEKNLNKLPSEIRKSVLDLIKRLFPQIDGLFQYGYSTHGYEWQSNWSKSLRVCAVKNFDSYFTLIPGGDEEELSQYEIETVLSSMTTTDEFEKLLNEYIKNKKIKKVLERIEDYTDDPEKIPQDNFQNIVQALFNISDILPKEETGFFSIDSDMEIMRIILQILKRENNKNKNYEILKNTISLSKGIFGPIQKISLETPREDREKNRELLIEDTKLAELQKLCVEKINDTEKETLLKHKKFLYILYRWKEWGEEKNWKQFISDIQNDEKLFWLFLKNFISESKSQSMGDYAYKIKKKFNYEDLQIFLDINKVSKKIEQSKDNPEIYDKNKETIDLFLSKTEQEDL